MHQRTSEFVTIKSGVPQGSMIGPLLFCLFINDICSLEFHSNTKVSLYADDTALSNHGPDVPQVQQNLQKDFDLIEKWLEINDIIYTQVKPRLCSSVLKRKFRLKTR